MLITRASMGNKLQMTFFSFHSRSTNLTRRSTLCRSTSPKDTGIEMDPKSIFTQTAAMHTPSLGDMMKVENEEGIGNLQEDTSLQRKRVK